MTIYTNTKFGKQQRAIVSKGLMETIRNIRDKCENNIGIHGRKNMNISKCLVESDREEFYLICHSMSQ
jgi:hypothetical protein